MHLNFRLFVPDLKFKKIKIENLDIESKFEFLPDGSPSWSGVGCLLDFFVSFLLKLILKLYRKLIGFLRDSYSSVKSN